MIRENEQNAETDVYIFRRDAQQQFVSKMYEYVSHDVLEKINYEIWQSINAQVNSIGSEIKNNFKFKKS